MIRVVDENMTIEDFLFENSYKLGDHFIFQPIYNEKEELLDKEKTLKDYGFLNNDYIYKRGDILSGGSFMEKNFLDNIILSDLIKEINEKYIEFYSPSKKFFEKFYENSVIAFDVIGTNNGPVFGGKNGKFSFDSNISKAAVFEGKVKIGKKAIIFIKIMKNKNIFEGETKNGITTSNFRFITDWCFSFTNDKVLNENYYYPKYKLVKKIIKIY